MPPKALLFDVFGTVVDWRSSIIAELTTLHPTMDAAALADAWRAAYAPSMDQVRQGQKPWTNLDILHRTSLESLALEFGLPNLTPEELDHLTKAWHRLTPWPDSVPGLTRLKTTHIISPLSNGNVALLTNMAKHAGLPWDLILCAELFHHYKPDPETYQGAAALLALQPNQVMLCAAHNNDLAAARAQGLRTAFIPRPTEYGPTQTRDLHPESDWDIVAPTIEALAERLHQVYPR